MKIETGSQHSIGFIHDTLKNHYLIQTIIQEIEENQSSSLLASHSIVKDVELVKALVDAMRDKPHLTKAFRDAIEKSKSNQSSDIIYAANCITILVASQYSFSGQDLSNISIRGANVTNGIFYSTNFTNADLTNVVMRHTILTKAKFHGTNLQGVDFGKLPDLIGHYSPDGKFIASGSYDNTV